MEKSTPLYLGPPRDRRRHRRLLTRENTFFAFVALLVTFAALSLWGESGGGDVAAMNRLFGARVEAVELRDRAPVIDEADRATESYADPLLVSHARRSAVLGVNRASMPTPVVSADGYEIRELTPAPRIDLDAPLSSRSRAGESSRFVISGGAEGVELQVKPDGDSE